MFDLFNKPMEDVESLLKEVIVLKKKAEVYDQFMALCEELERREVSDDTSSLIVTYKNPTLFVDFKELFKNSKMEIKRINDMEFSVLE